MTITDYQKKIAIITAYYQKNRAVVDSILNERFEDESDPSVKIPYKVKKELIQFVSELPFLSPTIDGSSIERNPDYDGSPCRFSNSIKNIVKTQQIKGYVYGGDIEPPLLDACGLKDEDIKLIYKVLSQPKEVAQRTAKFDFKGLCYAFLAFKESLGEANDKFEINSSSTSEPLTQQPDFVYKTINTESINQNEYELINVPCDLITIKSEDIKDKTVIDLVYNPRTQRDFSKFNGVQKGIAVDQTEYPFATPVFAIASKEDKYVIVDGATRSIFCAQQGTDLNLYVPRIPLTKAQLLWMQNNVFDTTEPLSKIDKYYQINSMYNEFINSGENGSMREFERQYQVKRGSLTYIFNFCHTVDRNLVNLIGSKQVEDQKLIQTLCDLYEFKSNENLNDEQKNEIEKSIFRDFKIKAQYAQNKLEKLEDYDEHNHQINYKPFFPKTHKLIDSMIDDYQVTPNSEKPNSSATELIRLVGSSKSKKHVFDSKKGATHQLKVKGLNDEQIVAVESLIISFLCENGGQNAKLPLEQIKLNRPELYDKLPESIKN
ncbi:hypothetical protein [Photobacterium leiognathi]|uniref:hypothetical protein n=1 Tax=Photobacterium leiognathi TaxID=553611 RepID=UPI002982A9DE|nr:hypothetical protein [Photobacterium leiognathi]